MNSYRAQAGFHVAHGYHIARNCHRVANTASLGLVLILKTEAIPSRLVREPADR